MNDQSPNVPVLTIDEIDQLITSMEFTLRQFSEYKDYPTLEFRNKRIAQARLIIDKLYVLKKLSRLQ